MVAHLARPTAALPDTRPALVGFVVSRAVGPATVRHRVERRLRHLVAAYVSQLPPGSRLVLRALPPAAAAPGATLAADLEAALGRLLASTRSGAAS